MNFNIAIGTNPRPSWESLGDAVLFLRRALESCGHRVMISDTFVMAGAVNIFLDRIHYYPELVHDLVNRKVVYGIIFTEVLDSTGRINWGIEEQETGDIGLGLRQASFIWCVMEESVVPVRAYNSRTYYLPFGYVDGIATIDRVPTNQRDIDFLITGIITERRAGVLTRLAERGFRTHAAQMVPHYIRDALMARAHLNLTVSKFDGHDLISPTRVSYSVINRVPMLTEVTATPGEYAQYCATARAENLVEAAIDFYSHTNVDDFAEEMFRKFKAERDMTETMRDLISRIEMRRTATSVHTA